MVLRCRGGIDISRRFGQLLSLKTQFEEVAGAREYPKDEWSIGEWLILKAPEVERRNCCTCRSPRLRMQRPFKAVLCTLRGWQRVHGLRLSRRLPTCSSILM